MIKVVIMHDYVRFDNMKGQTLNIGIQPFSQIILPFLNESNYMSKSHIENYQHTSEYAGMIELTEMQGETSHFVYNKVLGLWTLVPPAFKDSEVLDSIKTNLKLK